MSDQSPKNEISLAEETLYPHLKITREAFPRLLVTRKIIGEAADYFGAFLPATGVRFWLEFISRTFRLRTCEIEINGKFSSPCTQFYTKRCVAPCVESLCDRDSYLERVEMVRLFLQNDREKFNEILTGKIESAAENLEFESAARWRDMLQETNKVFVGKDWNLWLDEAVDTYEVKQQENLTQVFLVTQRGRKTLGKKAFAFENKGSLSAAEILSQVIAQFYKFHVPKEIRVPIDFPNRLQLAKDLSRREKHLVKITVFGESNDRKTSLQALKRARFDFDFKQIKPPVETREILQELKTLFGLGSLPRKIEAFDAAHISGQDFTAAKITWQNGKFIESQEQFWLLDEKSELQSLQKAVVSRFAAQEKDFPDLLLIDGGKSQLQAVLKALEFLPRRKFKVISAVKPPQQHNQISHFLSEDGQAREFSNDSEAMKILLRLRDEAHDLANDIHRQRRETSHFYELAQILPSLNELERRQLLQKFGSLKKLSQASNEDLKTLFEPEKVEMILKDLELSRNISASNIKPLIVPLRIDEPNGEAKDLRPLNYTKI